MIISKPYHDRWLSKDGTVTLVKDMKDQHLIKVLFYIDALVRAAWEYEKPEQPIADNVPAFVGRGYGQLHYNICPDIYWNIRNELRERGLY